MKDTVLKVILVVYLVLGGYLSGVVYGQKWSRIYKDTNRIEIGKDILPTDDGGYLLVGHEQLSAVNQFPILTRGLIIKVDRHGREQRRVYSNVFTGYRTIYNFIRRTLDGGYIVGGESFNSNTNNGINNYNNWHIIKYDINLNVLWYQDYSFTSSYWASGDYVGLLDIEVTPDGGYVCAGSDYGRGKMIKLDDYGAVKWSHTFPGNMAGLAYELEVLHNENEYVALVLEDTIGYNYNVYKFDSLGNILNKDTMPSTGFYPSSSGFKVTSDGHLLFSGTIDSTGNSNVLRVMKVDSTNTITGQHVYPLYTLGYAFIASMDVTPDGGVFIASNVYPPTGYETSMLFSKLDSTGTLVWSKSYVVTNDSINTIHSVRALADSTYIVIGSTYDNGSILNNGIMNGSRYAESDIFVLKLDKQGETSFFEVIGRAYYDVNNNCMFDTSDFPLFNHIVQAVGDHQVTFTGSTDHTGSYKIIALDTGNYTISMNLPPFSLYESAPICGVDSFQVRLDTSQNSLNLDFPQTAFINCPIIAVNLSTPLLRRCFVNNIYTVTYQNQGTQISPNTLIKLELDPYFLVDTNSLSIPYIRLLNNTFVFDVGTVNINESGSFNIEFTIDCSTTQIGQTHCSQVSTSFDTTCLVSNWQGAIIEAEAACAGQDSVQFTLRNVGDNMNTTRQYWVYEDNIMLRNQSYQLNPNQSLQFKTKALGQTYRIEAQQEVGFPIFLGDTIVRAVTQGCDTTNINTTGLITALANYDGSPFLDIDCQQNIGSYDPNDKRGFPTGVGAAHYITKNTPLDYNIRFQNTGTDTAFTVVIVDTLDAALDITTLRLGASSHAYTLNVYGVNQSILEFTFNNIMLPDSNVNEPLSHGFIQFSIDQQANNPLGTVIENQAAIYFDFDAPIFTNTTWHTVGENFIQLVNVQTLADEEAVAVQVIPNPFQTQATIQVEGLGSGQPLELQVYNLVGQQIEQYQSSSNQFNIQRGQLETGVYVFRIVENGQLKATGKFIVQ